MTRETAIEIIKRVNICANAAETARDMAIAALRQPEIVFCCECEHREDDDGIWYCTNPDGLDNYVKPDDYCSYGKREVDT